MKNFIFKLFSTAFLLLSTAFSQNTAGLEGKITDSESGEGLAGVKVYLIGTNQGTYSAEDGTYSIYSLKPGTYSVLFSYMSYAPDTVEEVQIREGEITLLDKKLGGEIFIDAVEILAEKTLISEISLLTDIKNAREVVVGISSEQIAKTQDRDASEIMKRIPGVSVVDNRFVMVRGLSQRYNSVLLNGAFAPSIEADIRSFSFDLIPSSAIDRMMVYKSPSAELPGEFAGGLIKIYTRNVPEKNSFSVNYSSSFRQGSSFQDFAIQNLPDKNVFGLGAQGLNLPDAFPTNVKTLKIKSEILAAGKSLPMTWSYETANAMPDQRFQLTSARRFKLGKMTLGNITTGTYSSTRAYQRIFRNEFDEFHPETQKHDTVSKFIDDQFNLSNKLGLMHNWALIINPEHKIEFRNLYNQTTNNQTTLRQGEDFSLGSELNSGVFYMLNRWIYSGQMSGKHQFNEDRTQIEWTFSHGRSFRNEPFVRRYRSTRDIGSEPGTPYSMGIVATPDPSLLGSFFSTLNEKSWLASSSFDQKFNLLKAEHHLLAGFLGESKTRNFQSRNLGYVIGSPINKFDWQATSLPIEEYMTSERIDTLNGLKISEATKPADSYTSSNQLLCGYVAIDMNVFKKLHLTGGVRVEHNQQKLNSSDNNNDTVEVNNPLLSILPSLNFAYNVSAKTILRLTAGSTVNRPEFRELAPFTFYDFNMNTIYGGNPLLQTPKIMNLDLRYEWYPELNEMVSFGMFYKHFTHSIEQSILAGSTSRPFTYSYSNAESAFSAGLETEVRKSFASWFQAPIIQDISLVANASLIYSKVQLDSSAAGIMDVSRPLQGQSPYIVNGGLYYSREDLGLQISALYNVIGKRISVVGFDGFPSVWEMPRHVLDLTVSKSLGRFLTLRLGIQDLLNQGLTLIQDADNNQKLKVNSDDQIMATSKPGAYYTAQISMKF